MTYEVDSFGGKIGNICWQNTWNELWGHSGFWDKRPGVKPRFILWGIRPKYSSKNSNYYD
jgi:hypothetical protein